MNGNLNDMDHYLRQKRYRLINSVIIYKDNELIYEKYYNKFDENSRNNIKSIWKSILSICLGIALDKGYIKSVDQPIGDYIEEFNGGIHPFHKLITIRHLLTMSSGIYWNGGVHYHCPMLTQLFSSDNWLEHISHIAMKDVPGGKHVYKEWDVMLLSALIERTTGMNSYEFCDRYLYKPLDIKSGKWTISDCGISYNISRDLKAEAKSDLSGKDLAKIGMLFLNGGIYNGEQIISKEYINQALTPSEQDKNYGYLWWLFDGYYGCRGYGGQEINVIPEKNIVYVIQATPSPRAKSYEDVFLKFVK